MHVLMTVDTVGGVWTYAIELARALRVHGYTITFASMGAPLGREQREQVEALPNVRVAESSFRLEWMESPWDDVRRAGEWLLELEARERPDVVHLNGYAHGALPWSTPVVVVAHSCVLSWWRAVNGVDAPPAWARYRDAVRRGIERADLVVAPSRAMLSAVLELYANPAASEVIPNGRDPVRFSPGSKDSLVLTAGRLWDEAKNAAAVERIALRLSWPVYVAGDASGPDGGALGFSAAHHLGKLGERDLAAWMARAGIYALPARYEPFGLSVLEAALAGCALVLGDIPSLREIWDDAALYVHPDDDEELRVAIESLVSDDGLRARFGWCARRRACRYAPARMAECYHDAYTRLVAREAACEEARCAS
jgi:glycosyltransferase involved in cell wall biosynthesis